MAFDWKKLEREQRDSWDRAASSMGIGWIVVGVAGPVVVFLVTGSVDWADVVMWFVFGLIFVLPAVIVLRRRRRRD